MRIYYAEGMILDLGLGSRFFEWVNRLVMCCLSCSTWCGVCVIVINGDIGMSWEVWLV